MAKLNLVVRVAGAPPMTVSGNVETVRHLRRFLSKCVTNIRGVDRFLKGYSDGKVSSATIRPQ